MVQILAAGCGVFIFCLLFELPLPSLVMTIILECLSEDLVGACREEKPWGAMFCGTVVLRQLACDGVRARSRLGCTMECRLPAEDAPPMPGHAPAPPAPRAAASPPPL